MRKSPLNRNPVGTGPYIFKEWEPGTKIIALRVNPDYFEGRAYIDNVTYRVIPDMATLFLELRSGGLDWMPRLPPYNTAARPKPTFFKKNFRKYKYLVLVLHLSGLEYAG